MNADFLKFTTKKRSFSAFSVPVRVLRVPFSETVRRLDFFNVLNISRLITFLPTF